MAFDPRWTVGWRLSELVAVAQRLKFFVHVLEHNRQPTALHAAYCRRFARQRPPQTHINVKTEGEPGARVVTYVYTAAEFPAPKLSLPLVSTPFQPLVSTPPQPLRRDLHRIHFLEPVSQLAVTSPVLSSPWTGTCLTPPPSPASVTWSTQ